MLSSVIQSEEKGLLLAFLEDEISGEAQNQMIWFSV